MKSAIAADIGAIICSVPVARRRELVLIGLLIPLTAIAELVMITAIVPILAIIGGSRSDLPMLDWISFIAPASPMVAAAILFVVATLATSVLRLILSWKTVRFSAQCGHDLNVSVQHRLLHQHYLFHVYGNSSRTIALLDKVDLLVIDLVQRSLQGLGAAIISVAIFVALLLIDPVSAMAVAFLGALLFGIASLIIRRRLEASTDLMNRALERRIQAVQESAGGIRDVIIDRSQSSHLAAFASIDEHFMHARANAIFLSGAPRYLIEGVGFCLIAMLGLFLASQSGGLASALPILGALVLGSQRLLPLASQMQNGWTSLASSAPILHDVATILRLPLGQREENPKTLPFHNYIQFQAVGFHYPDRFLPSLTALDFVIPYGARVAIGGKTGSGKSTLADLLMGLIKPTEGQIWVDDTILDDGTLAAWRTSVAHVPQSIFLADTTIARNISLTPSDLDPDIARVKDAAAKAHIDEFITSLPDGFDTLVGERGARLSGGQRQRLALARAIYRQPKVLILDEATSALDDETETAILSSLDQLQAGGCTIVIVAHRQATLERCDIVLMLDEGKLIEVQSAPQLRLLQGSL